MLTSIICCYYFRPVIKVQLYIWMHSRLHGVIGRRSSTTSKKIPIGNAHGSELLCANFLQKLQVESLSSNYLVCLVILPCPGFDVSDGSLHQGCLDCYQF